MENTSDHQIKMTLPTYRKIMMKLAEQEGLMLNEKLFCLTPTDEFDLPDNQLTFRVAPTPDSELGEQWILISNGIYQAKNLSLGVESTFIEKIETIATKHHLVIHTHDDVWGIACRNAEAFMKALNILSDELGLERRGGVDLGL